MADCLCRAVPLMPWPSSVKHPHYPTNKLTAFIAGVASLQPLALYCVLRHLSPCDLQFCPPSVRSLAVAAHTHRGTIDLTGVLAPVFTSREHMEGLRDPGIPTGPCSCNATPRPPFLYASSSHNATWPANPLHNADSSRYDPGRLEHFRVDTGALSDYFKKAPHRNLSVMTPRACKHPRHHTATLSPESILGSPQYPHKPPSTSALGRRHASPSSASPHLRETFTADRYIEPASFLPTNWLTQGHSGPFMLPTAPSLTLQCSDVCFDVLNILPTLLHSCSTSGMTCPRVCVTPGQSWPPPTDADMLATVPFLTSLQSLSPLSLELSGLPLYLSDVSRWAPALASMTQLTRLDLKLDTWKLLPAQTLAASVMATRRQQKFHSPTPSPVSAPPGVHGSGSDGAAAECHAGQLPAGSTADEEVQGGRGRQYNTWINAKAKAAQELATHMQGLSQLRHLAIYSCSCEWTAPTLRSLTCSTHLSHLELHWIDNAQGAARHIVPAVASLISAAFPEGVWTPVCSYLTLTECSEGRAHSVGVAMLECSGTAHAHAGGHTTAVIVTLLNLGLYHRMSVLTAW